MAVIAIAAFFVVSSLSLSNRLDEDYAPRNWRYRWILLDGSLALIYLMVFMAVAWLWRPVSSFPLPHLAFYLFPLSPFQMIMPFTHLSYYHPPILLSR
jgi:hypothetical protein